MNIRIRFSIYRAGVLSAALLLFSQACKKGLDYKNQDAIVPDNVWTDPNMIKSYLNDIYGASTPDWPFDGSDSDEGIDADAHNLSNYQQGIVTVENTNMKLSYEYIDRINYFLDKLSTVPGTVLNTSLNTQYVAEAKFWRAWRYWNMVREVGGVPLILGVQNISDLSKLFVPRNKTSECIAQIVKDLDEAIAVLPAVYTDAGNDYGRITKIAAMAFKGRVLLWYASPLFNPTNDKTRWQAAYDANKAAKDAALAAGYGLFGDFKNIWYQERNKEVIMVNQHFYPGNPIDFGEIKAGTYNENQPYLPMLLGFPKRDGSPLQLDVNRLSDPNYNSQFLKDFYTNRDPRFYSTVFFGGVPYVLPDQNADTYRKGETYWCVYRYISGNTTDRASYKSVLVTDFFRSGIPGYVGFYDRKGLDTTVADENSFKGQTDWLEMRYAEVLMNYGECANEIGLGNEALDVLHQIRQRAGIIPGNGGNYGITAASTTEIRSAIMAERFIEFAFEGKRSGDLRRWKRYDLLNAMGTRSSIYIVLRPDKKVASNELILNDSTRNKFYAAYINSLDGDDNYKFKYNLNHWFSALNPGQISQSKNMLQQNSEWGGSFDPLQ
ncbi:RagB/SusD family nutrient uptake outer membrane protein [Chitinophaga polysaccharea]|uniref:RagB/SusD family nutrient uptake outer membrane protein n=1 Tax=Chitinophaga TaxID=79328 RepID=UPI0014550567|nr:MULTISPECIES: RagB/SusD family nutrient uptake outer membrane protein [Chitinophaga]NLR56856.1 RagB/SusD family nutrient uptake outer membrane protein [Chitinophaga polysaccharea]NLU93078.1 RagB/SusD family nutrient uptake outer membrane protein [Chitinophaga sp. Ak27]